MTSRVLIIDYGSQFTQLIARRVREARVYSEIHPPVRTLEWIKEWKPTGIIFSGGPNSVYGENVPTANPAVLDVAPILGVCYGMNLIATDFGGSAEPSAQREYGHAQVKILSGETQLFQGLPFEIDVWMSHGDHVTALPEGFHQTATTGEMITADQAQQMGMINSVVPDAELMQRAISLAERLAAAPTAAIAQIKKLLEASAKNDCRSQLELEREAQLKQGQTKDFMEGVSSFLEKRPPRFIGS